MIKQHGSETAPEIGSGAYFCAGAVDERDRPEPSAAAIRAGFREDWTVGRAS